MSTPAVLLDGPGEFLGVIAVRGRSWHSWGVRGCSWTSLEAAPRCDWTKVTSVKQVLGSIVTFGFRAAENAHLSLATTREALMQLLVPRAYRNGCYDDVAIFIFV